MTPARRYILDAIEQAGRIIDPSMEEALRIDAMTQPLVEGGPRRNRGEASLIVCATSMTQRRVIVLDDRDGMRLATANDIPTCTTRRLLIEMIDSDAANEAHSWRMAQRCFNESDRRRHDLQLARHLARFRSETS